MLFRIRAPGVRRDLVDWAVPMNYSDKHFDRRLAAYKKEVGRSRQRSSIVVGIFCKYDADEIIRQVRQVEKSGCRGYALFSYSYLFDEEHALTKKGRQLLAALR